MSQMKPNYDSKLFEELKNRGTVLSFFEKTGIWKCLYDAGTPFSRYTQWIDRWLDEVKYFDGSVCKEDIEKAALELDESIKEIMEDYGLDTTKIDIGSHIQANDSSGSSSGNFSGESLSSVETLQDDKIIEEKTTLIQQEMAQMSDELYNQQKEITELKFHQ